MSKQVVLHVLPSGRNVVAGALAVALMMPNAAAFAGQSASEGFAVANDASLSATEDAQNQIDALEEAANQAKSECDKAAAVQNQADAAYTAAQNNVSAAEKALTDAQAAYDAARAGKGTVYDFFESIGDGSASKINDTFPYRNETNLGQEDDASYLDNFARTFQYMNECNAIRASLGLSELKITSGEMAIALADCNWSDTNYEHAGYFERGYNGENLAWGYSGTAYTVGGGDNDGSPFHGWYDEEKQLFDEAVATGNYPDIENMTVYEIYTKYPALCSKAGHYLNIINPDFTTTGFAYNTVNNTYDQTFGSAAYGYKTYTVKEYEALFNSWRDQQTASEKAALELAKTNLASAQKAASDAQSTAEGAAAATQAAQASYNEAYADFVAACIQESSQFSDVDTSGWYAMGVGYCAGKGLFSGYAGTTFFGVGDSMTRAQLAVVLWRHFDAEDAAAYDEATAVGTDAVQGVESYRFYTGAANWAVAKGVINGVARDGGVRDFAPNEEVTFEQLIAIIANASGEDFESTDTASLDRFTDVDAISDWAATAMAWAVDRGLVNGSENEDGSRSLLPGAKAARERTATVLMNAFQAGVLK